MILNATCPCGNTDTSNFEEYDGILGYEAIICTLCGRFSDHMGEHEADEWSKGVIAARKS